MKPVRIVPMGCDFIEAVRDFLEGLEVPLNRTAIIFPGKRPGLYLKEALAATRKAPFFPPASFSVDGFIDHLVASRWPGLSDVDQPDAVWMLFKAVRSLRLSGSLFAKDNFGDFFPWGSHLLSFIESVDVENVPQERLLSVEENAAIGYDVPESVNLLLRQIVAVRSAFHALLETERCLTRGYKYLKALEALDAPSLPDFDAVIFAGLFATTEVERRIVRRLWEVGQAEIILEGNPGEWPVLNELVRHLGAPVEPLDRNMAKGDTMVRIYSGFDTHAEALHAASILGTAPPNRTAVVLPLPATLFPLLTFAVDRWHDNYNVSIAYPLSRTSLFSLMDALLRAQDGTAERSVYAAPDYLGIILHPFVKNARLTPLLWRLLSAVKEWLTRDASSPLYGKAFLGVDDVEEAAVSWLKRTPRGRELCERDGAVVEGLKKIHHVFFRAFERPSDLAELSLRLQEAFEFLMLNTELKSYVLSGEIFTRLIEALEDIKRSRIATERFHDNDEEHGRALRDFLRRHLKHLSVPFDTTPLETLEILGLLETRSLRFETVLILDINEGVIPAAKHIDPLVPVGVYESLGLPAAEEHEEVFRYYFQRLVAGAREAHLIYVEAEDKPRSRYIEMLIWQKERSLGSLDVVTVERSTQKIRLRTKKEPPSFPKTPAIIRALAGKTFSPSSIDDYVRCPVFFYHRHMLRFEEEQLLSSDIEDSDRGTIIHAILFDTFAGYLNRPLAKDDRPALLRNLDEALNRHFDGRIVTGDYYLFRRVAEHKLKAFLQKHIDELDGPVTIAHLEEPVEGSIPALGPEVRFRGRIDRVDYVPATGMHTIIDYKTGGGPQYSKALRQVDPASMEEIHCRVPSLQLPLYVQVYAERASVPVADMDAVLALLKTNKEEHLFKGIERDEKEGVQKHFMAMAATVLTHLRNPAISFAPFDDRACPGCAFNCLCGL